MSVRPIFGTLRGSPSSAAGTPVGRGPGVPPRSNMSRLFKTAAPPLSEDRALDTRNANQRRDYAMKNATILRRTWAIAALLILAVAAASTPRAAAESEGHLEPLGFLTGAWGADGAIVEYWLPPLRGLMVGVNRSTDGDDGIPSFEYLRIESRVDGIYYVASPNGKGTTSFKLTESSASRAVFENAEHDFPQKIIYTRTSDHLEAEVGANQDGEWSSFKLNWSKQP